MTVTDLSPARSSHTDPAAALVLEAATLLEQSCGNVHDSRWDALECSFGVRVAAVVTNDALGEQTLADCWQPDTAEHIAATASPTTVRGLIGMMRAAAAMWDPGATGDHATLQGFATGAARSVLDGPLR